MNETEHDLVDRLQSEERARLRVQPPPPVERPTIPVSKLPEDSSDRPLALEWNFYCRAVGRLLSEGNEGKWILIKGTAIVGIWDSEEEADRARLECFLQEPVLLKQIRSREPILRGGGYDRQWRS